MSIDIALIQSLQKIARLNRATKKSIVIATDGIMCVISVWVAFSLRLDTWVIGTSADLYVITASLILWGPIFYSKGVYNSIFRFSGSRTITDIGKCCIALAIFLTLVLSIYRPFGVPRTVAIIHPILLFLLISLTRITARYFLVDVLASRDFIGDRKRVIIYGAGTTGKQLASTIRNEPGMVVVAFVDDDDHLKGKTLDGIKIFPARQLPEISKQLEVTDVLLAMPKNTPAKNREIVKKLQPLSVHVRTVPRMSELVDGEINTKSLREINVLDLLGRDPVPSDPQLMSHTILGKTVIVTGAGGSIGGELCRQIVTLKPRRIVLFEMTEYALYAIEQDLLAICKANGLESSVEIIPELGNVTNRAQVSRMFARHRPDTVFHAAAYKHVPLVEANPIGGMYNNVFGTFFVALEAHRANVAHFMLISTDKAVRPTNIMGATKRVCELILQALSEDASSTRFSMVRFGNVLGSSGSVVPRFEKQIREGGPVTLTHENVTRYFMTIPEAAQLVIQAGAMAEGGDVFLLDMGEPVKIIDLARAMIELSGHSERTNANPDGDIEITVVGLRAGEKLYEELLIGDNPQETRHPRIMRAKERMIPKDILFARLEEFEALLVEGNASAALKILREFVPEFTTTEAKVAQTA